MAIMAKIHDAVEAIPTDAVVLVCGPSDVDETGGIDDTCNGCGHRVPVSREHCDRCGPPEAWIGGPGDGVEHVHDVGPAWDEDGTPYALCATCGHRWDRQTCEVCGLNVTGLVIAGAARHPHHDLPNTRKD